MQISGRMKSRHTIRKEIENHAEKIVQLNEVVIKSEPQELVRGSVEETLNELLEAEAEKLTQAARYERNEQRRAIAMATTTAISPPLPGMLP